MFFAIGFVGSENYFSSFRHLLLYLCLAEAALFRSC